MFFKCEHADVSLHLKSIISQNSLPHLGRENSRSFVSTLLKKQRWINSEFNIYYVSELGVCDNCSNPNFVSKKLWNVNLLPKIYLLLLCYYRNHHSLNSLFLVEAQRCTQFAVSCVQQTRGVVYNFHFRVYSSASKHISRIIGIKWFLRGAEHLEKDRTCVFIANHQSSLDVQGMISKKSLKSAVIHRQLCVKVVDNEIHDDLRNW